MPEAEEIRRLLGLEPLEMEGGFYRETYRAGGRIAAEALPPAYRSGRSFSTAIYYLLTPESFSTLHRLPSDEIFLFHLGDPVEMLQLRPDGGGEVVRLGPGIEAGDTLQAVVPGGVWQGCRLAPGGRYALLSVIVAPGFEFEDYEHARREELLVQFPAFRERILALTR